MSITKSFNKRIGVYYAYETSYEWDETKQRKVQKRRCIGRYNPDSNEIEPNGKVGRPANKLKSVSSAEHVSGKQPHRHSTEYTDAIANELLVLKQRMSTFEKALDNLRSLSDDAVKLKLEIDRALDLIK